MRKKHDQTRESLLVELLPQYAIYAITFLLFFYCFKRGRRYLDIFSFHQVNVTSANISKSNPELISLSAENIDHKIKAIFIYINQTNLTENSYGKYDHGFCSIKLNRTVVHNDELKNNNQIAFSTKNFNVSERKKSKNIESYDDRKIVAYSPHSEFPAILYPLYFSYGAHDYYVNMSLEWTESKSAEFVIGFQTIKHEHFDFDRFLHRCLIIAHVLCIAYNIVFFKVSQWPIYIRFILLALGILTEFEVPYSWMFLVRIMRMYVFLLINIGWNNTCIPDLAFLIFFGLANCYEFHYSFIDEEINDYTYKYSFDLFDIGLSLYLYIVSFPCRVKGASKKALSFLFVMSLNDAICSICHGKCYSYAHFHQILPLLSERIRYLNVLCNLIIVFLTSAAPFAKKNLQDDEFGLLTDDIKQQMYLN